MRTSENFPSETVRKVSDAPTSSLTGHRDGTFRAILAFVSWPNLRSKPCCDPFSDSFSETVEKWFEQRLKRGSGRYTESRCVQKVAFRPSCDHVTVVSETFHTVSLSNSMNKGLLICPLALWGRIGAQPQRDVGRLHRLSDHAR